MAMVAEGMATMVAKVAIAVASRVAVATMAAMARGAQVVVAAPRNGSRNRRSQSPNCKSDSSLLDLRRCNSHR